MKEIFVFGAGASHASGETPLGKDLVWSYCSDCFNGSSKDKDFLEFLKAYPRFKKSADKEENRHPATLHILDAEKSIDEVMKELVEKSRTNGFVKLIRRLAVKHITGASEQKENELYKRFVQSLAGKTASEICVISLNFDCLLHEEFKITNVYEEVYFDYLLPFQKIDESRKCYEENRKQG